MIFKSLTKNFYINLIFIFLIFILDRVSKVYVIYLNEKSYTSEIFSSKFLNISLTWNQGIAFGLFSLDTSFLYHLISAIILIIIVYLVYLMVISDNTGKIIVSFILGGAVGNVYDRLTYFAVPDFIDFHVGNMHWFTFNFADIFISLGIFAMVIKEFILKKNT